jgi:hypothetical protein
MANVPRHIHKRLLHQNLATHPSPYLHELTLVPNFNQTIMETLSLQQTLAIFAKSQGVELAHFLEDFYGEVLCVHSYGCCEVS